MEENQQIQRAIALQKQGHSIRQIAIELGISKSKVFRWLSAEPNNTENKSQLIQIPLKTTIENYTKTKNNRTMENNNESQKLDKEIALKKLQLDHELELRKIVQQEKELDFKRRELEIRHLEKDSFLRQQKMEERKLNNALSKWLEKESDEMSENEFESNLIDLADLRSRYESLNKIFSQIEEHMVVYDINPETHPKFETLESLVIDYDGLVARAEHENKDDLDDEDFIFSYEYYDKLIENVQDLECSDFLR